MNTFFRAFLIAAIALTATNVSARPGDRVDRHPFHTCQTCVANDYESVVATDAEGNFVVAWSKAGGYPDMEGVWARRFAANGTPLGDEFRVSPEGATANDRPAIAMTADGRFVVTWLQRYRPDADAIVARRFASNGAALGGLLTVSSTRRVPGGSAYPDVAIDDDGNFVIAWPTYEASREVVRAYARSYDSTGAPRGPEFFVAGSNTVKSYVYPQVAMGSHGQFVAIWRGGVQEREEWFVRGRRFDLFGTAAGNSFLVARPSSFPGGDFDVAAQPDGAFTVAYVRFRSTGEGNYEWLGVFARRFTAQSVAQGPDFRVSTSGITDFAGELDVDVDDDGDFVIVWIGSEPDSGLESLHVRLYEAGGRALTRDLKYLLEGVGPRESQVAMDANGDFVVTWKHNGPNPPGTGGGVSDNNYAQRFAGPDDRRGSCAGFIARILGTSGNDTIYGTAGDDVVNGFGGNDVLYGGGGEDALCGAAGDDQLFGEAGDDFLSGGSGDDVLDGGTERDVCIGNGQVNADTALQCENIIDVP